MLRVQLQGTGIAIGLERGQSRIAGSACSRRVGAFTRTQRSALLASA